MHFHLYSKSTPQEELDSRILKLQAALGERGMDGALVVQKTDLFYFSGTAQQGWLYVPVEGAPLLMVFKEFDRAKAESALAEVISLPGPKKITEALEERDYVAPLSLGMELDVLPVNLYFQFQTIFKGARIEDISLEIRLIRAVKSAYELELIKTAAAMADKVAAKVPEILEEGRTELSLAGELEAYARSLGHQGIIRMRMWGGELFYGHFMSGPSAAVPSYLASPTGGYGAGNAMAQGAGFSKIKKGEPVLVDYVFALNGYLSDHARIFSIGPLPDFFLRAHDAMLEIQETARREALPGTRSGDLYDRMIALAKGKGYEASFMGVGDRRIRFTGHGIGLELDEFPFIAAGQKTVLKAGMVVALEPKVILPGKGVVGIENTHHVTKNGLEPLTTFREDIVII